jgi:ABC-type polysaccharide/polyol phosphate transport system ATPase subunit
MSDVVISVENLSKSYLIGHDGPQERYHSLRDTLVRHGKNYARKAVDMARGRQIIQGDSVEEFWALKDVSFEVKQGEVLGIIGRNGAGKSTLLKILSRITEPTSGRVTLNGRVASLLEVGTGFHPELTGRENIFLNGAILGMSKAEIKKKFDEIVDFAGVEKFLDTPVKRYSSGMYVRLAFAVAAHLEPEILIVDEVLAVGDAEFQKKCLGKMQDVAKGGRTVLFVSHNIGAINSLCAKAMLLSRGGAIFQGSVRNTIHEYNRRIQPDGEVAKIHLKFFSLIKLTITNIESGPITPHSTVAIEIEFTRKGETISHPDVYLAIKNQEGILVAGFNHCDINGKVDFREDLSKVSYRFLIESLSVLPGTYEVWIELKDHLNGEFEFIPEPTELVIESGCAYGQGLARPWHGFCLIGSNVTVSSNPNTDS